MLSHYPDTCRCMSTCTHADMCRCISAAMLALHCPATAAQWQPNWLCVLMCLLVCVSQHRHPSMLLCYQDTSSSAVCLMGASCTVLMGTALSRCLLVVVSMLFVDIKLEQGVQSCRGGCPLQVRGCCHRGCSEGEAEQAGLGAAALCNLAQATVSPSPAYLLHHSLMHPRGTDNSEHLGYMLAPAAEASCARPHAHKPISCQQLFPCLQHCQICGISFNRPASSAQMVLHSTARHPCQTMRLTAQCGILAKPWQHHSLYMCASLLLDVAAGLGLCC